jgi:hypothetical protein
MPPAPMPSNNNIALLPKPDLVKPELPKAIDRTPRQPNMPPTTDSFTPVKDDRQIAKSLPSDPDGVVEFKVIWQELFHTLSVRVKQFTNQIPSYVAQRSQDLSHWLSDRMAAMRQPAQAPVIAPSSSATPVPAE